MLLLQCHLLRAVLHDCLGRLLSYSHIRTACFTDTARCRGMIASNEPPTLVVQPWWLDHLHTKVPPSPLPLSVLSPIEEGIPISHVLFPS